MKVTRWSILVAVYVTWSTCAYAAHSIFGDKTEWYDYSYFLGERLFVLTTFWAMLPEVQKGYQWIIKTLICVASWRLVYVGLVILKVIKPNDFHSLMGLLFTAALALIVIGWGKLRKR